jgi:hypothetical protein
MRTKHGVVPKKIAKAGEAKKRSEAGKATQLGILSYSGPFLHLENTYGDRQSSRVQNLKSRGILPEECCVGPSCLFADTHKHRNVVGAHVLVADGRMGLLFTCRNDNSGSDTHMKPRFVENAFFVELEPKPEWKTRNNATLPKCDSSFEDQ